MSAAVRIDAGAHSEGHAAGSLTGVKSERDSMSIRDAGPNFAWSPTHRYVVESPCC